MNQHLEKISEFIQQHELLSAEDKTSLLQLLKNTNKELEIIAFKLDRTEKVKRTTAILLEETIQELEQKRKAVEESNLALEKSLVELKAAQQQLIQSEKMASLGELTAGIAHEIQNPLNFINNFSEINKELLEEVKSLRKESFGQKSKLQPHELDDLLNDIAANEEKINHHGKRADAIVKGMLQHSRSSSGQKEQTSLNALCEEYLRLCYHGIRAKDSSFNTSLHTDYDDRIEKVPLIPQDIGRVLLNVLSNAFYAVNERKQQQPEGYEPTVSVATKALNGKVEIQIADNGNGIPKNIVDKIFQPFFTTKPTGQGTGLGLSLAYDIIQAHHGELNVTTKEGEYTTFTIRLPQNSKL